MKSGLSLLLLAIAGSLASTACTDPDHHATSTASVSGSSPRVLFHYDALGRLIQAVAPDGASADYHYDAVGNITAIRRRTASTLSIADFTPRAGMVGSTVTIYGSGFSADPGDDTVTFNGAPAEIRSASATELVVQVPAGATTGNLAVASATGSATSELVYTVAGTSPIPTIVGFTPPIGGAGTTVTVTGTNFQRSASGNKVTLAGQPSLVVKDASSPAPTQLAFIVPSSTASGAIAITTPYGRAVSATEFFVTPAAVNPGDVGFTGRIAVGGPPVAASTIAAGKQAMLLFDGQAGQWLHLRATAGTFPAAFSCDVYDPAGDKLATFSLTNNSAVDFPAPITRTGTYVVIVRPRASDQGGVQLAVIADATGALVMDGSTAVTLTGAQNAHYTFAASAGQGYGLAVPGLAFTPSGASLLVTLRAADGTALTTCSFTVESSCNLPGNYFATAGTYTLDFDPGGVSAVAFTAVLGADTGGAIQIDAAEPTGVTFARPGQNARYTFDGTAGQRIHVVVSASALINTAIGTPINVFRPSSPFTVPFANATLARSQTGLALDVTLPETGRYAVTIDPAVLASGTVALQLRSEVSGALAVNGTTAMRLAVGQNARYRFTAQAGTGYGLALTGLTLSLGTGSVAVTVRKPDETAVGSCSFATSNSCDFDPTTFATTGPYLLDIDPSGMNAATLSVVFSADQTGAVSGGGAAIEIARSGQNARIAFSGAAGVTKTFVLSGTLDDGDPGTLNNTAMIVFKPSSPTVAPIVNGTLHQNDQKLGISLQLTVVLPETGDYTIFINPTGLVAGNLSLEVK